MRSALATKIVLDKNLGLFSWLGIGYGNITFYTMIYGILYV